MTETKFKKGDLVRLIKDIREGINLRSYRLHTKPCIERATTPEEVQAWRNSPSSKGLDCAGESKLPPMIVDLEYDVHDTFTVLRARCSPKLGYYKKPKRAQVMNNRTCEIGYIERRFIEKV
jgi:hypothetical protein